jgi:hypothetical protein
MIVQPRSRNRSTISWASSKTGLLLGWAVSLIILGRQMQATGIAWLSY